jgi:trans-aconitate methyltransferase
MALARDYFRERLVGYGAQPRFLDVGCGIGTKVLLAQQMNFEADGLDFVPEYCEAARELCGSLSTIHDADAREFDKYGDYDLIYAYRPLVEEAETAWLTGWIAEQLKPGSLMFLAWWPEVQTDSLHKMSEAIYVRTAAG